MRGLLLLVVLVSSTLIAATVAAAPRTHDELVKLFEEWRAFQRPRLVDGVPDYGAKAMAAQARALRGWLARVAAFDTAGWSLAQQNDLALVRAEMNGVNFNHRVRRPWANDPAFYVTVFSEQSDQPLREGPWAVGAVELWQLTFPLDAAAAARLTEQLRPVAPLLTQARANLTGNGRDLWTYTPDVIREQAAALADLEPKVKEHAALLTAIQAARTATEEYATWVAAKAKSKTGPSGVGKENYEWYLANVQLVPYTWAQQVTLMERELARTRAALQLEELRNRNLPEIVPATTVEEHDRRLRQAVDTYVDFLRKNDLITWQDWMRPALSVMSGTFRPTPPLEFFYEVEARDPMLLRLHMYHFVNLAWMERVPNADPIRRGAPLHNIFITRTEGLATALEELMMHAGLFEGRPRSRELVYVMASQRAARAQGDLRMHAREWTLEEAAAFASANTPRGWMRLDGHTVRGEQLLYLRQPGYGTSYLTGKLMLDELVSRRRGKGPYPMKQLLDGLNAAGLLPMSLLARELTL